jgi:triosephosphate isomerase (TIM)
MRRYLVAGNWKLNMGPADAVKLARPIAMGLLGMDLKGDVLVCPPYVSISPAADMLRDSAAAVGAQNCATHDNGAYTGEVSAVMLKEAGATHVIIGHSERREYYGETDEDFIAKIDQAQAAGMIAIFCYGEKLEQRKAGQAADVVRRQLEGVLPRLAKASAENLVLAYEPVWAIGTGETASPEQAQEIHGLSRKILAELSGKAMAAATRILYGGSMKPGNAEALIGQPDIDGGLIGGASLKADDFLGIVRGAQTVS